MLNYKCPVLRPREALQKHFWKQLIVFLQLTSPDKTFLLIGTIHVYRTIHTCFIYISGDQGSLLLVCQSVLPSIGGPLPAKEL